MKLFKLSLLGLVALALIATEAPGQFGKRKDFKKNKDGKGKAPAAASSLLTDPLEPADLVARLKLAGPQKLEMDKLFREFDGKLKEIASKAGAETGGDAKARFKGGKAGKGGAAAASPSASAAIELRQAYGEKFEAMLTEPQKKVVEDYRVKQGEALLSGAKK